MKKKLKVIVIVPIKSLSRRVPGKNFKKVGNKPLYKHLLDKLSKCKFDEIYVDSDSPIIKKYCKNKSYKYIERIPYLAKDSANGNDLLSYHSKILEADLYFQLYITAPLLKIKTINNCIKILKNNNKIDSILTSKSKYSWYWFKNKPVNYKPRVLPRSQEAIPVVVETTGLYGIKKESLKKRNCRIGYKPYFYEVSDEEAIDLDNKTDFEYLDYLLKKKN